jgi:predicted 2-oxoglutarate/Fe(II)-dependent dioxygenase YbiX
MKYAVEMRISIMIYIPSLIKVDSVIQNLIEVDIQIQTYRCAQTHRLHGDRISLSF